MSRGDLRQARFSVVRGLEPADARRGARAVAAGRVLFDRRVLLPGGGGQRANAPGACPGDPRSDLGSDRRAGDGGHCSDTDPGQADLGRGQAVRRPGGDRPRGRGKAPGRPAGDRDHRDCGPAGGPAGSLGHHHLPRPGASRSAAGSVAPDRHGRGPLVGAQWRRGAGDPHPAPAHKVLSRGEALANRPPDRWSSTPGWSAISSG